ncbi:GDSL esterase/lipase At5g03600-like [Phragmites australis]|uniref:GDSL esterase/lipase At5g03600-like n=1 Tax=Phragmites australis TaxID=29695 RepID=UPI002D78EBC7|nr:GDSL esterase/lipase At5g03600-like [Phragmites australis]
MALLEMSSFWTSSFAGIHPLGGQFAEPLAYMLSSRVDQEGVLDDAAVLWGQGKNIDVGLQDGQEPSFMFRAAAHVESRRHGNGASGRQYKLYVFGDSFADTGNYPLSDLTRKTRAWYYPYGSSDVDHGTSATGRFSNGLVLPDFLARIMGREESPPAESQREQNGVDPSGMNFAVGGAGAYNGTHEAPKLGKQIDKFRSLVKQGIIEKDLKDSVALIAFSGKHDYAHVKHMTNSEIEAKAIKVTDKIADGVELLMELGVTKVMVSTLPPLDCTPWLSRSYDYDDESCDSHKVASIHNAYLEQKVFQHEAVFMLDLETAFNHLVVDHHSGSSQSKHFKYQLRPCCDSFVETGYCGQMENGKEQYSVCSQPENHFYWDEINPTHDGWETVMNNLKESIKNFLDI